MVGVREKLIRVSYRALEISPIDFGIGRGGGLRTTAFQRVLFENGDSQKDGVIHVSKHQLGAAIDPAPWIDGPNNDPVSYAIVAGAYLVAAGEMGIKLWWGGLWPNFRDLPHIQLDESEYE
jgi:peptidoglycan L-alanyl-D-glutamate endopeptidase CwlK